ncbi:HET-domain-containing protein [Lophiostoma macrostomum CBS 122681]|uniref:HET-domain-containing protein n=1 Tax=Lophiostoma macrostomum CBS 122681 TaxID=1314788 RepID=A0A6A6T6Y1_9PLEO|nr:HET-domain-containing protein [Lophiostoma macrostomum CBS 122681]
MPPRSITIGSSITQIEAWLSKCDMHGCSKKTPVQLPTRLIDMGNANMEPRLQTIKNGELGTYTALSHCWGDPAISTKRLISTRDNVAIHHHSIPLDTFPNTFRDAIMVTRGLGLRYVWIDSLCIIQDDTADWENEAGKMTSVYSNAYITLAAAWGSHSDCGLIPRGERHPLLKSIKASDKEGNLHEIYLPLSRPRSTHPASTENNIVAEPKVSGSASKSPYENGLYSFCYSNENTSMLETRAWTLQERVLSQRVVHFGYAELEWECRYHIQPICHCGELSRRDTLLKYRQLIRDGRNFPAGWQNIVSEYTRRQMTYSKDRLPALDGLTKAYTPHDKLIRRTFDSGSYIAGMWFSYIPQLLPWYTVETPNTHVPVTHDRMPQSYAPSWSWASVLAPVQFANRDKDLTVPSWTDFRVELLRTPTYQLPALVLLASVMPIRIANGQDAQPIHGLPFEDTSGFVWLDAGQGSKESQDPNFDFFALFMDKGDVFGRGNNGNLILRKQRNEEDEIYSRIGYASRLVCVSGDTRSRSDIEDKIIKII